MIISTMFPAFISFEELTIILLFSVIIFGPKKIPEIARGLGEGMRMMKKATDDIKQELMKPVEDINPVKDIQKTIEDSKKEVQETLQESKNEIEETLDDTVGPIKRN